MFERPYCLSSHPLTQCLLCLRDTQINDESDLQARGFIHRPGVLFTPRGNEPSTALCVFYDTMEAIEYVDCNNSPKYVTILGRG